MLAAVVAAMGLAPCGVVALGAVLPAVHVVAVPAAVIAVATIIRMILIAGLVVRALAPMTTAALFAAALALVTLPRAVASSVASAVLVLAQRRRRVAPVLRPSATRLVASDGGSAAFVAVANAAAATAAGDAGSGSAAAAGEDTDAEGLGLLGVLHVQLKFHVPLISISTINVRRRRIVGKVLHVEEHVAVDLIANDEAPSTGRAEGLDVPHCEPPARLCRRRRHSARRPGRSGARGEEGKMPPRGPGSSSEGPPGRRAASPGHEQNPGRAAGHRPRHRWARPGGAP
mmetsp:Transcript_95774/g.310321  ORF Transcript_95774/g.310321 Transcript_95774/m.310321 type:complete len:287 (+) Transcript_95774:427-1287(+)